MVCSIGNGLQMQECIDSIYPEIPNFSSPPSEILLYRVIHELVSLMSGSHYDVRWISKEYQLDDQFYDIYLKDVQIQIKKILDYLWTFILI